VVMLDEEFAPVGEGDRGKRIGVREELTVMRRVLDGGEG
jgi:hypothetical protein